MTSARVEAEWSLFVKVVLIAVMILNKCTPKLFLIVIFLSGISFSYPFFFFSNAMFLALGLK